MTETKTTPMHKLACALLALVMAIGICVPTMAFADESDSYTITVENPAYVGETYTAYKVFDATYTGSGEDLKVSYTIDYNSAWYAQVAAEDSAFDLTQIGSSTTYTVTLKDGASDEDVIATLTPVPEGATEAATGTVEEGARAVVLDVTESGAGYYYVTTTVGSVVSITSAAPDATIYDKNTPPTVEKEVVDEDEGTFEEGADDGHQDNASVGETLEYQVTISNVAHTANLCLHDQVTDGLTFSGTETIKVYLNDYNTTVDSANYTITTGEGCSDECIFEIAFDETWLDTLADTDVIIVTYEVVVNEDAVVIHGNDAWVTFGVNSSSTHDTTETDTYGFELKKVDDNGDALDGATFTLADSEGNLIEFYYDTDTNTYIVHDESIDEVSTTDIVVTNGDVYVFGLEEGTYTLTETVAPDGYNMLSEPITVTIEQASEDGETWTVTANGVTTTGSVDSTGTITWPTLTVENNAGQELPGTGGMGTTIFYIIGGILVVGAVVVLITRRRMSNRA